MDNRELYQQKKRAQLGEWQADLHKLKSKASGASADAQIKINKKVEELEHLLEDGKSKLAEVSDASENAWESIKDGVESAWGSMRTAFKKATAEFKS